MVQRRSAISVLLFVLLAGCSGEDFSTGSASSPDDAALDGSPSEAGVDARGESDASVSADAGDEADSDTPDVLADAGEEPETGPDAPPVDAGSDVQADADAGDEDVTEAGPDVLAETGSDAGDEPDVILADAGDESDALADAGDESDADTWDGFIPVCIDDAKDCQGLQPLICKGGQWVNNGAPCEWACQSPTSYGVVCNSNTRYDASKYPFLGRHDTELHLTWVLPEVWDQDFNQMAVACAAVGARVPTLNEMTSIALQPPPAAWDTTVEKNTPGYWFPYHSWYWTATKFDPGKAWGFDSRTGEASLHYLVESAPGTWCVIDD